MVSWILVMLSGTMEVLVVPNDTLEDPHSGTIKALMVLNSTLRS